MPRTITYTAGILRRASDAFLAWRDEVRRAAAFREAVEAAVPVAVEIDLPEFLPCADRHFDQEIVAAPVAFLVGFVHPRRAVERLVEVADVVDDEAQGLRALGLAVARLQHTDVALQGLDDVDLTGQVGGDGRLVNGEREVGEVLFAGEQETFQLLHVVGPVRGVDEIQTLFRHLRRVDGDCHQLLDLGLRLRVEPVEGDLGDHHVPARPPAVGRPRREQNETHQHDDCRQGAGR